MLMAIPNSDPKDSSNSLKMFKGKSIDLTMAVGLTNERCHPKGLTACLFF